MGIHRENGYSAIVEGFLVVDGARYQLAKTNGTRFVLAEPCEAPPNTDAELLIIVDGTSDVKPVTLIDGIVLGQSEVRYERPVPF